MNERIAAIADLHARLGAALAAGDVEVVHDLVQERQAGLEALQEAWDRADPAERGRHLPSLQILHSEETTLLRRCQGLCADLQAELASRQHRMAPDAGRQTSTILDCTA